jgi:dual-specificity kinase
MHQTDKKRKTAGSSAYDPVYNPQPSYSTTQTPYYDNSSSNNTASTDRTTSAYITTAATSLGSQGSNGTYLPPLDDGIVGQKRKRTRAAAAEEAQTTSKRREVERPSPLSILYVPPQKPIIKAKDVPVEVIPDVCGKPYPKCEILTDSTQKSYPKIDKVDDDDGHYIVEPERDLTERCQ